MKSAFLQRTACDPITDDLDDDDDDEDVVGMFDEVGFVDSLFTVTATLTSDSVAALNAAG